MNITASQPFGLKNICRHCGTSAYYTQFFFERKKSLDLIKIINKSNLSNLSRMKPSSIKGLCEFKMSNFRQTIDSNFCSISSHKTAWTPSSIGEIFYCKCLRYSWVSYYHKNIVQSAKKAGIKYQVNVKYKQSYVDW